MAVAVPTARVGRLREHLGVLERPHRRPEQHDAEGESAVPDAVDDERLLSRVRGRLPRVPEPDQEVAAEPDRLPEHVEQEEVPGQHQHDHREDEEIQVGEEARVVRVLVHVAGRVDVDQEPDPRHDQQHHRRELVELERHGGAEGPGDDPVEERARERLVPSPDAEEGEERHDEGQADGRDGNPVRAAPEAAAEGKVDDRARERQRGNRPDEVDHPCAAIGCKRNAARGAPRAVATCALTLADPLRGVKARSLASASSSSAR